MYAGEREREVMYAGERERSNVCCTHAPASTPLLLSIYVERERERERELCCTHAPASTPLLCILCTAYIEERIYIYIERERERSNVSCTQAPALKHVKLTKELTTVHAAGAVHGTERPPASACRKERREKNDAKYSKVTLHVPHKEKETQKKYSLFSVSLSDFQVEQVNLHIHQKEKDEKKGLYLSKTRGKRLSLQKKSEKKKSKPDSISSASRQFSLVSESV